MRSNSGKYDLLICEVDFPGEYDNPRATIQKLMEEPGTADIPVMVITGNEDTALPINAFRNGVAEYFFKQEINKPLLEYRTRNLLQREFRSKIIQKQIGESLQRFQKAHGMSQNEIQDLNAIVQMMKQEMEEEFEVKMKLEADKNKMQSVFGMYVDPNIVKGIMNNEISIEQKGRVEDITILFADIRGYTTLSEQMSPEQVISFLNEYFTSMTEVIMGYNGMVDKYIGDGIMCLFGTPVKDEDHRGSAVQTAMEMQSIFELWKTNWEASYGIVPAMGVGVASGTAIVGNVGSFQKISYTAVGDTVNTAARLESMAKPGWVLISEDLYNNLDDTVLKKYDYEALEPIEIKGKSGKHQVYRVTE